MKSVKKDQIVKLKDVDKLKTIFLNVDIQNKIKELDPKIQKQYFQAVVKMSALLNTVIDTYV